MSEGMGATSGGGGGKGVVVVVVVVVVVLLLLVDFAAARTAATTGPGDNSCTRIPDGTLRLDGSSMLLPELLLLILVDCLKVT